MLKWHLCSVGPYSDVKMAFLHSWPLLRSQNGLHVQVAYIKRSALLLYTVGFIQRSKWLLCTVGCYLEVKMAFLHNWLLFVFYLCLLHCWLSFRVKFRFYSEVKMVYYDHVFVRLVFVIRQLLLTRGHLLIVVCDFKF